MMILGIDPGPTKSGVVQFDTETRRVVESWPDMANDLLNTIVRIESCADHVACESIEAMYAHVGKETIRTIRFTGRIEEAVESRSGGLTLLSPQEVKKLVCNTAAAKDPAVRQALIDTLGPQGTKKEPGPTYGVSKHAWRALAVAVAASMLIRPRKPASRDHADLILTT